VKPLKCCNSATPKRQRPPCREGILTDVVSQRVVLRSQRQQKKSVVLPNKHRAISSLCAGYACGNDCKTWRTQAGPWSSSCSSWSSNCALCIPDTEG